MDENTNFDGAVVVFGMDRKRRPRAGIFLAGDAEAATSRGRSLSYLARPLSTAELVEAAQGLPQGDLTADDGKFVPAVARQRYDKLLAAGGIIGKPKEPDPVPNEVAARLGEPLTLPASFSEIEVGTTVLAKDDLGTDGWFEALVLERRSDDEYAILFRGYPHEGVISRRRDQLGLLPAHS